MVGCPISTQDYKLYVVGVLVDTGLCGGCTVSTHDFVFGVLIDPGLHGRCTG